LAGASQALGVRWGHEEQDIEGATASWGEENSLWGESKCIVSASFILWNWGCAWSKPSVLGSQRPSTISRKALVLHG
jgi:hypothetical protein